MGKIVELVDALEPKCSSRRGELESHLPLKSKCFRNSTQQRELRLGEKGGLFSALSQNRGYSAASASTGTALTLAKLCYTGCRLAWRKQTARV